MSKDLLKPRIRLSELHSMKQLLRKYELHTVCEEANCPNISTCFVKGTATVLIMGKTCTRNCRFCNINQGIPAPLDPNEPERIAELTRLLNLKHLVITSVTRDDLPDGGASQFIKTIQTVKKRLPNITVEVLIPDLNGNFRALRMILDEEIAVFNHNVETVPSLYPIIRRGASFQNSIEILKLAKAHSRGRFKVKSGFMLGLGEEVREIEALIHRLSEIPLDILTIGQYHNPSKDHAVKVKTYSLREFENYRDCAIHAGIPTVYSAPEVRSSYHAENFL